MAAIAAALLVAPAAADDEYPFAPERLSKVYENETARFDTQSVSDRSGMRTFDVVISANNPAALPPGSVTSRTVRYFARCADGEIAVSVIALMDGAGRLARTVLVPPGTWDYFKPESGSEQASWLERACRRY
jgi:hypothetical protein